MLPRLWDFFAAMLLSSKMRKAWEKKSKNNFAENDILCKCVGDLALVPLRTLYSFLDAEFWHNFRPGAKFHQFSCSGKSVVSVRSRLKRQSEPKQWHKKSVLFNTVMSILWQSLLLNNQCFFLPVLINLYLTVVQHSLHYLLFTYVYRRNE